MALGFIPGVDIGIALVDLGASLAIKPVEYGQVKSSIRRRRGYQEEKHQALIGLKAAEIALGSQLLTAKGKTSILEDLGIKKAVGIGGISIVGLVILSLIVAYIVGRNDIHKK